MDRRGFLVLGAAAGAAGAASAAAQAQLSFQRETQSRFSYEPGVTVDEGLPVPADRLIKVAFAINPGVQVIDLAGPWEVFQDVLLDEGAPVRRPFELYTVSETTEPVRGSGGLTFVPDFAVDDAPAPDLLVIPHFSTREVTAIHAWIATAHQTTTLTASICTGAFQLAKTGLLDGLPATTNQDAYDLFEERYPAVALRRGPRFVETGRFATAGGLSAGIDLALRVVSRCFGDRVTQETADSMEYVGQGWRV